MNVPVQMYLTCVRLGNYHYPRSYEIGLLCLSQLMDFVRDSSLVQSPPSFNTPKTGFPYVNMPVKHTRHV